MIIIKCMLLVMFGLLLFTNNQNEEPNELIGFKNYTATEIGNINIIITAAHGGYLKPDNIADRIDILGNIKGDYNSLQLANVIRNELERLFMENDGINAKPFLVFNNLHRTKMDPNRSPELSCDNQNDNCNRAYKDYHDFITNNFEKDFMINGLGQFYEQGLLFDIHGQSHPEKWIELGYLITSEKLDEKNLAYNTSSIRQIAAFSKDKFNDLIRGPNSFGGILQNSHNFKVVPSPDHNSPQGQRYYRGGFTTLAHGSVDCPVHRVSAIQIEFPFILRKNSVYKKTGVQTAESIYQFYKKHNIGRKTSNTKLCKK